MTTVTQMMPPLRLPPRELPPYSWLKIEIPEKEGVPEVRELWLEVAAAAWGFDKLIRKLTNYERMLWVNTPERTVISLSAQDVADYERGVRWGSFNGCARLAAAFETRLITALSHLERPLLQQIRNECIDEQAKWVDAALQREQGVLWIDTTRAPRLCHNAIAIGAVLATILEPKPVSSLVLAYLHCSRHLVLSHNERRNSALVLTIPVGISSQRCKDWRRVSHPFFGTAVKTMRMSLGMFRGKKDRDIISFRCLGKDVRLICLQVAASSETRHRRFMFVDAMRTVLAKHPEALRSYNDSIKKTSLTSG
jgi:hypothetical protein